MVNEIAVIKQKNGEYFLIPYLRKQNSSELLSSTKKEIENISYNDISIYKNNPIKDIEIVSLNHYSRDIELSIPHPVNRTITLQFYTDSSYNMFVNNLLLNFKINKGVFLEDLIFDENGLPVKYSEAVAQKKLKLIPGHYVKTSSDTRELYLGKMFIFGNAGSYPSSYKFQTSPKDVYLNREKDQLIIRNNTKAITSVMHKCDSFTDSDTIVKDHMRRNKLKYYNIYGQSCFAMGYNSPISAPIILSSKKNDIGLKVKKLDPYRTMQVLKKLYLKKQVYYMSDKISVIDTCGDSCNIHRLHADMSFELYGCDLQLSSDKIFKKIYSYASKPHKFIELGRKFRFIQHIIEFENDPELNFVLDM